MKNREIVHLLGKNGGKINTVENVYFEIAESPETVYNFHVEDYHTYHVGNIGVLVHNDCIVTISRSKYPESAKHIEDVIADGHPDTLTIDRRGATARRKQSLKGRGILL